MLRRVSAIQLGLAAGISTSLCVAMFVFMRRKYREQVGQLVANKAADKLRQTQPAMELLGNSFEAGQPSFSLVSARQVHIRIPIKGASDNGLLHAYAARDDSSNVLGLRRLEMTFDKIQNKRLALLIEPDSTGEPAPPQPALNKQP